MGQNRIAIGPDRDSPFLLLDNDSIISAHTNRSVDPVGLTLPIGTLEVVFTFSGFAGLFCPSDYPDGMTDTFGNFLYCYGGSAELRSGITYGTRIYVSNDDKHLGIFYVKELKQTGAAEYTLFAQDWAGVLDDFDFPGHPWGSASSNYDFEDSVDIVLNNPDFFWDKPAPAAVADVFSRLVYQFDAIRHYSIRDGYMLRCTKRQAIQQLLMVTNVTIMEQTDGTLLIRQISGALSGTIHDDRVYSGGDVAYTDPVSTISVTEYSITTMQSPEEDDYEVLFDNSLTGSSSDTSWIVFDAPYSNHISTGFWSVKFYGCFAKVRGAGVLQAVKMPVAKRTITWTDEKNHNGQDISVDCTMTSVQFSTTIMSKLTAYYTSDRLVISEDVAYGGEQLGAAYQFSDPFRRNKRGLITSMQADLSSVVRASCVIETDFAAFQDTGFRNSLILTGSGVWGPPPGVEKFTAVLIGGGTGGMSGLKGHDGRKYKVVTSKLNTVTSSPAYQQAGDGGKIYVVDVADPAPSYVYQCGYGGAGGAVCSSEQDPNPGTEGGNTVFGRWSSAAGERRPDGINDVMTYTCYGARLPRSMWSEYTSDQARKTGGHIVLPILNNSYVDIAPVNSTPYKYPTYENWIKRVVEVPSLEAKRRIVVDIDWNDDYQWAKLSALVVPGAPGACSGIVQGSQGTAGTKNKDGTYRLGDGGDGATPNVAGINPMDIGPYYGYGGGPGHPGGAGGASGYVWYEDNSPSFLFTDGQPGRGGLGGAGGPGAPGCIIIYY